MAGVRRAHATGLLLRVESERIGRQLLAPERAIEVFSQLARALRLLFGDGAVAEPLGETGQAEPCRVDVALDLAQRDRAFGKGPVAVEDGIRRVLPSLLHESVLRAASVLDEAVGVAVAGTVDPRE